jgi:hypothetical protein
VTVYYRDSDLEVTSEAIRTPWSVVPIDELTYVWHAKGAGTARTRTRVAVRALLVFLLSIPPLVAIVCLVSLVYSAQARDQWGLAATIVLGGAVVAAALSPFLELPLGWLDRSYEKGSGVQELWVQRQGESVMLVRSSDALRFGQIYRAVQRAVEQRTDPR